MQETFVLHVYSKFIYVWSKATSEIQQNVNNYHLGTTHVCRDTCRDTSRDTCRDTREYRLT